MSNQMRHAIIDMETGEILQEFNESYEVRTNGQINYLKAHAVLNKKQEFTKVFPDLSRVVDDLSAPATKFLCKFTGYVRYTSNLIGYNNDTPLTHKKISEIMKCSMVTTKRVMSELVDKKVLARCRIGKSYKYFANPYIFCKGSDFNATLVQMFKDYRMDFRYQK